MVYVIYKEVITTEDYFQNITWDVVDYGEEKNYKAAEQKALEIIKSLEDSDIKENYSYIIQDI